MGEVAEMMLDGTLCEGCGCFVGDPVGYPRRCRDCMRDALRALAHDAFTPGLNPLKTNCPACGKRVKASGLADHQRAVHGAKQ